MALNSTNHTIFGGSSCTFLRIFDDDYEDKNCVKGGDLKKNILLCREIPCTVKFGRRPQLHGLVVEGLTQTLAVYYEEPPSAKDLEALEDAQVANVPESVMSNLLAFSSQNRLDDLSIVIPCEHWRLSYLRTKSRAHKYNEAQVLANICITVRRKYK
jgi:hypothetical protein